MNSLICFVKLVYTVNHNYLKSRKSILKYLIYVRRTFKKKKEKLRLIKNIHQTFKNKIRLGK